MYFAAISIILTVVEITTCDVVSELKTAIEEKNVDEIIRIGKKGFDFNTVLDGEEGNTAMHMAVKGNKRIIVAMLMQWDRGTLLTNRNKLGLTPLGLAAVSGCAGMVTSLVRYSDADVQEREPITRNSLFHLGIIDERIIAHLIANELDINCVNAVGDTPLMWAAKGDDPRALEALLKNNAFVDEVNEKDGNTALHIAAERGNEEFVKLLLSYGASKGVKNDDELTPEDLARKLPDGLGDRIADMLAEDKKALKNFLKFFCCVRRLFPPY